MKVKVHQRMCVASGNCGYVAPRVFENPESRGGFVKLVDANPPESEWSAVREAGYLCPSGTIQIGDHPIPPSSWERHSDI